MDQAEADGVPIVDRIVGLIRCLRSAPSNCAKFRTLVQHVAMLGREIARRQALSVAPILQQVVGQGRPDLPAQNLRADRQRVLDVRRRDAPVGYQSHAVGRRTGCE
jgi:hypothetical protein